MVGFKKDKAAAVAIIVILCLALLGTAVLAASEKKRADTAERYMNNSYLHALNELVTSLEELDIALQKSVYATSPSTAGAMCTVVFGKAMIAQMSLGSLPFSTQETERTAGFISHVGDYALALSRAAASGMTYTEEERDSLAALSDTACVLALNMSQIRDGVSKGTLGINELPAAGAKEKKSGEAAVPETLIDKVRMIESEFPEIPSLIYDGPFSEHITSEEPKLLKKTDMISSQEGLIRAARFLGVSVSGVKQEGEIENSISAYVYSAGDMTVTVTKKGGVVMSALSSKTPEISRLYEREAAAYAKGYLARWGYENMKESYHTTANNIMLVNFVYEQDGVACYPDLIKVGVSMADGSLISFDARGYISSHHERARTEPAADAESAKAMVSPQLKMLSEGVAIIPSEGKYEILCYEFICENDRGEHYIIYVNADTGQQQKILKLIEDETGALAI